MILAVTGASGTGKTSVLRYLRTALDPPGVATHHFDDVGVPDFTATGISPADWQRDTTSAWVERLVAAARAGDDHLLFEGSTRIAYLRAAFARQRFTDYRILLFDCTADMLRERLARRGQVDLYTPQMLAWADHLRREARETGTEIVATDGRDPAELAALLLDHLDRD